MTCSFSQDRIEEAIAFHGHSCPGLAIGIRAAEYGLHYFPDTNPADLVCVTETAMCALDAIQFFTGCSTGKGNLIILDYGKTAFSFHDSKQNQAFRFFFSPSFPEEMVLESVYLAKKRVLGPLSADDRHRSAAMREKKRQWIMNCSLAELFSVKETFENIPQRLPMTNDVLCEICGEKTMENRTHQYQGKTVCIPCRNKQGLTP